MRTTYTCILFDYNKKKPSCHYVTTLTPHSQKFGVTNYKSELNSMMKIIIQKRCFTMFYQNFDRPPVYSG